MAAGVLLVVVDGSLPVGLLSGGARVSQSVFFVCGVLLFFRVAVGALRLRLGVCLLVVCWLAWVSLCSQPPGLMISAFTST